MADTGTVAVAWTFIPNHSFFTGIGIVEHVNRLLNFWSSGFH